MLQLAAINPAVEMEMGQRGILSHAERQLLGLLYTLAGRTALANYRVIMRTLAAIYPPSVWSLVERT